MLLLGVEVTIYRWVASAVHSIIKEKVLLECSDRTITEVWIEIIAMEKYCFSVYMFDMSSFFIVLHY